MLTVLSSGDSFKVADEGGRSDRGKQIHKLLSFTISTFDFRRIVKACVGSSICRYQSSKCCKTLQESIEEKVKIEINGQQRLSIVYI